MKVIKYEEKEVYEIRPIKNGYTVFFIPASRLLGLSFAKARAAKKACELLIEKYKLKTPDLSDIIILQSQSLKDVEEIGLHAGPSNNNSLEEDGRRKLEEKCLDGDSSIGWLYSSQGIELHNIFEEWNL